GHFVDDRFFLTAIKTQGLLLHMRAPGGPVARALVCSDQLFRNPCHHSICSGIAICVGPGRFKCRMTGTPTVLDGPELASARPGPPLGCPCGHPKISRHHAEMDCVSTRTPTPMVEDSATLRRYTPLLVAGLALFSASISAARLPCSLASSN